MILSPIKNAILKLKKHYLLQKRFNRFLWCTLDTLACYMIEGGSSKDYAKTRTFLWNNEENFLN